MVYTSTEKYIADMLIQGVEVMARTGDYPNFEAPVNTDGFLWEYEMTKKGWCLQKNLLSGYARIIDNKGIRRGNGTMVAMKEKFVRLIIPALPEPPVRTLRATIPENESH